MSEIPDQNLNNMENHSLMEKDHNLYGMSHLKIELGESKSDCYVNSQDQINEHLGSIEHIQSYMSTQAAGVINCIKTKANTEILDGIEDYESGLIIPQNLGTTKQIKSEVNTEIPDDVAGSNLGTTIQNFDETEHTASEVYDVKCNNNAHPKSQVENVDGIEHLKPELSDETFDDVKPCIAALRASVAAYSVNQGREEAELEPFPNTEMASQEMLEHNCGTASNTPEADQESVHICPSVVIKGKETEIKKSLEHSGKRKSSVCPKTFNVEFMDCNIMESQVDEDGSVTPRSKKYGLRVRLGSVPKSIETQTEAPAKKKAMTNAERSRRFREKRAADVERQHCYLEKERKRSQLRRAGQNDQERQIYNTKASIRNARYRAKKRELKHVEALCVNATPKGRSKRLDENAEALKKEKERRRVQQYRDNMTPQKRRRTNEKRMQRYYAKKAKKQNHETCMHECERENVCGMTMNGQHEDEVVTVENENVCNAVSVGEPNDNADPLIKVLADLKCKRSPLMLKFIKFLSASLTKVRSKYKKTLGLDSKKLNKKGPKTIYKKKSKVQGIVTGV